MKHGLVKLQVGNLKSWLNLKVQESMSVDKSCSAELLKRNSNVDEVREAPEKYFRQVYVSDTKSRTKCLIVDVLELRRFD